MHVPFLLLPPSGLLLQGLNALLRRETWAREQLGVHSGKSLRLEAGDRCIVQASIASDGLLQPCDPAVMPDVALQVPADRLHELPAVWRREGLAGVTGLMQIRGDAALARLVSELAQTLRWDVEDDLSRLVGDVLAVRLMSGARHLASGLRQAAHRMRGNVEDYLGSESGIAVRTAECSAWAARGQALASRLDGLEARVRRLEQAC
jgi:ubiquinone biosynthesis protein UbiJ